MIKVKSGWSHTSSSIDFKNINAYKGLKEKPLNLYGLEYWVVRNLLIHKNCLLKNDYFKKNEYVFYTLFGKENIKLQPSDKKCLVLSVNETAVTQAKLLIY